MTMTWEVKAVEGGTRADITADEVPGRLRGGSPRGTRLLP
jgi:hypothetical protein